MTITRKIFPFIKWFPEVRKTWRADVIAGILVAVILIPQSLAYSQMAGMPAHYGLYASFLPIIFAALWGSSRQLSTGPAVVVSLLTLTAISSIAPAGSGEFIVLAAVLALSVGFIQMFMGFAKLGNLLHFVSHPVILGFVNAAAILIALSQIPKIFGFPIDNHEHIVFGLSGILNNPDLINIESFVLGVTALVVILLGKRIFKKIPVILVVVVAATLYSKVFEYTGVIVGNVPAGLPAFGFPTFNLDVIRLLTQSAFVIAIVAYMESVSIAKTLAIQTHRTIDPNQELIGQGMANIGASFSGASPVAGSFSRSAVNFSSGAKTGFASIVTGLIIAVTLLFFTDFLYYIPETVLAAVIISAVIKLIDVKHIRKLWLNYKYDGWVAVITFVATFILAPHLDYGIIIGIAVSIIVYAHRAYTPPIAIFMADNKKMMKRIGIHFREYKNNKYVLAVSSDHSLIFTNADRVNSAITNALYKHKNIKYLLFMSRGVNFMDSTAVEMLEELVRELKEKDITFVMVSIQPKLAKFIKKLDLYKEIGKENIFEKANDALKEMSQRERKLTRK